MRLFRLSLIALLLLTLVLASGACKQRQSAATGASGARARHSQASVDSDTLTLAYTGNFRGFQRPCGCVSQQNGGLPRAATAVATLRTTLEGSSPAEANVPDTPPLPDTLRLPELDLPQALALIECGNFADSRERQAALRAHTHLRVLAAMGAAAAVLGGEEAALPADEAASALADSPVPLLSCNLDGELEGVTYAPSIELAPGWHVIGVTVGKSGTVAEDAWASATDPLEGVRAALEALPEGSRAIVAAAQLAPALAAQLAAIEGVSAVIGHSPPDGEWPAELAPVLPPASPRAAELNVASLTVATAPLSWPVALTEEWADDEPTLELLREGNAQRLTAARSDPGQWRRTSWTMSTRFLPAEQQLPPAEQTYAGAAACLSCHQEAHDVWSASHHHVAYESLLEHHEAQTLDCLECHVTGLLLPGGYDPERSFEVLTDPLARVGCESCHGPGLAHVELMAAGAPKPGDELRILRSDVTMCVRCHDEYNSPDFDAATYWAKIEH